MPHFPNQPFTRLKRRLLDDMISFMEPNKDCGYTRSDVVDASSFPFQGWTEVFVRLNCSCPFSQLRSIPILIRIQMTVEEFRHLTLVQSVLMRPCMYTVNGTLPELLAFFSGCLNPTSGETHDDDSVRTLFDWLSQECGFDPQMPLPIRVYESLIAKFDNEQNAMTAIQIQCLEPGDLPPFNDANTDKQ